MADLYLTPAERYTAALGGFYYGDLPEPGTVYTQLIKDILDGATPDKEPKNILVRFIYSLYISDLGDPYPRYELAKLLYWKLHDITPTKSGSILTVTIDGKEDYMTINTDLSRLWYKVLFGSKTDVITEFPYIFNTMQTKLSDWELFGNVSVSGTPTPDNPVMPQGTGERTGNLVAAEVNHTTYIGGLSAVWEKDSSYMIINGTANRGDSYRFATIELDAGTYTLSITGLDETGWDKIGFYLSGVDTVRVQGVRTYTITEPTSARLQFVVNVSDISYENRKVTIMFTKTSTPLPYEPYGIKIPISSAGQTTPVYLGEVETTRNIQKQILTGTESVLYNGKSTSNRIMVVTLPTNEIGTTTPSNVICTHFETKNTTSQTSYGGIAMRSNGIDFVIGIGYDIINVDSDSTNVEVQNAFKAYLAAQYAAGTPVCVWYVLAEPETGIVNEPLMKIGDYADSMSRIQTGIDIPTIIGQNTLDVLTTVKPSSMSIEYTSAEENQSRSKRISLLKSPLKKGLIK